MDQRLLLGIVSSRNPQELTLQLDYLIHLNAKNMSCQCLQGNSNFSLRAQNVQNAEQHDTTGAQGVTAGSTHSKTLSILNDYISITDQNMDKREIKAAGQRRSCESCCY